jgi:PHP family Zn ribbon phosphoesterase
MARPFVVNKDVVEIDKKINQILDIDDGIEIIPAHILTPEGVYGGNERINQLEDFFGSSVSRLNAVETGLSADPSILGLIPELDDFTLLSNSDAHSAALNRIGREFTILEVNNINYQSIIRSIRMNKVVRTGEFHPTEGRYFLTGHRAGRKKPGVHNKNEYCFYSPKFVPKNDLCPICGKELTVGVLQRAYEIGMFQGEIRKIGDGPKRDYLTMVPLIEIISHSMGIKSLASKRILDMYKRIISISGTEVNLWKSDITKDLSQSNIPEILINNISDVSKGNFSFFPGGYDGEYGQLKIGTTIDFENVEELNYI